MLRYSWRLLQLLLLMLLLLLVVVAVVLRLFSLVQPP
jgi:hypothetical protein